MAPKNGKQRKNNRHRSDSGDPASLRNKGQLSFAFPASVIPQVVIANEVVYYHSLYTAFLLMVVYDVAFGVVGTKGHFISFLGTILTVGSVRSNLPLAVSQKGKPTIALFVWILAVSLVVKFSSPYLIGILVGEKMGLETLISNLAGFLLSFSLVWFYPGDTFHGAMTNSMTLKLMLSISNALFRMRKAILAVNSGTRIVQSWYKTSGDIEFETTRISLLTPSVKSVASLLFFNLLVFISLDCSAAACNFIMYCSLQKCDSLKSLISKFTGLDFGRIQAYIRNCFLSCLPITVILVLLNGRSVVEMQIVLMVYFCVNTGTFTTLDTIHYMSLKSLSPLTSTTVVTSKKIDDWKKKVVHEDEDEEIEGNNIAPLKSNLVKRRSCVKKKVEKSNQDYDQ